MNQSIKSKILEAFSTGTTLSDVRTARDFSGDADGPYMFALGYLAGLRSEQQITCPDANHFATENIELREKMRVLEAQAKELCESFRR